MPFGFRRKARPEYDERQFMPPERRQKPGLRERARRALELPAMQEAAEERNLVEGLIRPLILAGMNVCLVTSLIDLIRAIEPSFNGLFLQLGVFLVSLEGLYSARLMRRIELHTQEDRLKFRGGELVVLLLLVKLLSYIPRGFGQLLADIPQWRSNFGSFFEPWYVVSAVLALAFWWLALMMARDFGALRLHRQEIAPRVSSREYDMWVGSPGRHVDRSGALRRISGRFFWGGLALLVLAGLARVQLEQFLSLARPAVSGIVLNALVYFMLGLALLSQGQFQVYQANWRLQRIPVSRKVASQWLAAAVSLVVIAALVALLLPTDYSVGLLDALRAVLFFLVQLVMLIVSLPFLLLNMLLNLLFRPSAPVTEGARGRLALPRLTQAQRPGRGMPPLLQSLRALLFWAIVLGILSYSLYSFLHYRSGLFRRLVSKGRLGRLRAALTNLWRRLKGLLGQVGEGLASRRRAAREGRPLGRRGIRRLSFLSLSSLPPSELVQYFYLSILRRAARAGHPRRRHQTPYEYTASLSSHLAETEPELRELTEAFVEARYGRRPFTQERANFLKASWQRVRRALRLLRRRREGDGPI